MAPFKEWFTDFPASQNPDDFANQPTLDNTAGGVNVDVWAVWLG